MASCCKKLGREIFDKSSLFLLTFFQDDMFTLDVADAFIMGPKSALDLGHLLVHMFRKFSEQLLVLGFTLETHIFEEFCTSVGLRVLYAVEHGADVLI